MASLAVLQQVRNSNSGNGLDDQDLAQLYTIMFATKQSKYKSLSRKFVFHLTVLTNVGTTQSPLVTYPPLC